MLASIQDSWPVSWTSWERRFLPLGVCADAAFWWAETCWGGGGVFSRTSCAWRGFVRDAATSKHPRMNGSFLMRGRIIGAAIPRKARQHHHCMQMPGEGASVVHVGSGIAVRRTRIIQGFGGRGALVKKKRD